MRRSLLSDEPSLLSTESSSTATARQAKPSRCLISPQRTALSIPASPIASAASAPLLSPSIARLDSTSTCRNGNRPARVRRLLVEGTRETILTSRTKSNRRTLLSSDEPDYSRAYDDSSCDRTANRLRELTVSEHDNHVTESLSRQSQLHSQPDRAESAGDDSQSQRPKRKTAIESQQLLSQIMIDYGNSSPPPSNQIAAYVPSRGRIRMRLTAPSRQMQRRRSVKTTRRTISNYSARSSDFIVRPFLVSDGTRASLEPHHFTGH